jgi:hypothetical protein
MKTYSSAVTAYRAAGKAHVQVDFLSFQVKDMTTPATKTWLHFCSADDDLTVTVTDPDTGTSASRTFLGNGPIVAMDPIVRSEGAKVRTMTWTLSGVMAEVLNMVNGYNCREAVAQYFVGEFDEDTGLLLYEPALEFIGSIDSIEFTSAGLDAGGEYAECTYQVAVSSIGADLLRTNSDMRAVEVSARRSGDKIFKHSDDAATWVSPWGKESKSKRDREGGKNDDKRGGTKGGDGGGNPGRT